jgi:Transmembrane domain of unknown function (DUF3566)
VSSQPSKSGTDRPVEDEKVAPTEKNGAAAKPAPGPSGPSGPAAGAPKPPAASPNGDKPAAPSDDGPANHSVTRPEGIAPIKDEAGPKPPSDETPAWAKPVESGGSKFNDAQAPPFAARREVPGIAPAAPAAPVAAPPQGKPQSRTPARVASGKSPRKAQLQLSRLEPWSVMKFSFVMSLVCFVVLLVAVVILYMVLSVLGVFDAISDTVNSLNNNEAGSSTDVVDAASWFSFARVFGYTVLVGALNVVLITALSTVGSFIYNLAADLVGGVEVTLKEAE